MATNYAFHSASDVQSLGVAEFLKKVSLAAELATDEERMLATRDALVESFFDGSLRLPERFYVATPDRYARRPLYIDPQGRFSVVVMTWGPGQRTKLHDHGGLWVVECLYHGRIRVTNFEHLGEANGLHQFIAGETVHALPGESEYRLPPDEHHILENDHDDVSISVHIFGGNLENCGVFEPVGGGYEKVLLGMSFTE